MSALLKNRIVVAFLALTAGFGVSALREAGVPVECPPAATLPAPTSAPAVEATVPAAFKSR